MKYTQEAFISALKLDEGINEATCGAPLMASDGASACAVKILYVDEHLLVVDKPAGLLVPHKLHQPSVPEQPCNAGASVQRGSFGQRLCAKGG